MGKIWKGIWQKYDILLFWPRTLNLSATILSPTMPHTVTWEEVFQHSQKKKLQKVWAEMRALYKRITKKDWDETQNCRICKNHCKKSEPAPWDHHELVQNKQNFENGFMCHVLQKIFSLCVSGNAKSKKSSDCVLRDGALITLLNWQVLKNTAGKSAAWAMVCHEICNNRWE